MNPLELQIQELQGRLDKLEKSDRFTVYKTLQMEDGRNISAGRKNGTKIGTASDQKLGFYGVTPVDQPVGLSPVAQTGSAEDGTARAKINLIITRLEELGLIAS